MKAVNTSPKKNNNNEIYNNINLIYINIIDSHATDDTNFINTNITPIGNNEVSTNNMNSNIIGTDSLNKNSKKKIQQIMLVPMMRKTIHHLFKLMVIIIIQIILI